jgi:hypothetical protein
MSSNNKLLFTQIVSGLVDRVYLTIPACICQPGLGCMSKLRYIGYTFDLEY